MFIQPDEHIILFDYADGGPEWYFYHPLAYDEMARFHDAGVQTIARNLHWKDIEVTPGTFNWDMIETWLMKVRRAGLKALLNVGSWVPAFYPADWYCARPPGFRHGPFPELDISHRWFSPWCAEAQARLEAWLVMCREMLSAEDVLCAKSGANDGETLLDPAPAYFDPHALADFAARYSGQPQVIPICNPVPESNTLQWLRDALVGQAFRGQQILALNRHDEIWSHLHMCFQDTPVSGNGFARELYAAYREVLKPGSFHGFCYGYFWVSDLVRWRQHDLAGSCGQQLWVGSERCEGLARHTPLAIAAGARGFVTGPNCADRTYPIEPITDWHYQAVRDSLSRWREARGGA